MVVNKHTPKLIIALMLIAVLLCLAAIGSADKLSEALGGSTVGMEYEQTLFDTDEIISIDIQMDQDEWEDMLKNALSEEYYKCDVVVNGTKFSNVAIRPKGNTSLSAIAMNSESDRYSFKLEFGHYVAGQTCFGLDKLILNNNYADATNMKEAIVYDMYQFIGADASLYNYASISLNGEYQGVYLALEAVEQSFMLRNYGTKDGELYKPDSMEMGGGTEKRGGRREENENSDNSNNSNDNTDSNSDDTKQDFGDLQAPPSGSDDSEQSDKSEGASSERPSQASEDSDSSESSNSNRLGGGGPGGGFSMGGSGADLNYTDDELSSYSTIWNSEITSTGDADHRRVVKAIKNVNEGTDLEKYLDIDNVLKYMAVHEFAVNMDSLSGSMTHNYYLYESDGQLNILPWDYNLSFGGMSMGSSGSATSMVNDAIDTPFSATKFFDKLLENEEYKAKYHEYLKQLAEEYVEGGVFDKTYNRIRSQIDSLVETDPTAFYTYDEYDKAANILHEVVELRAESIEGQIDGSIPSTDDGQQEDSSTLIDASHINLKDMGEFDMGGGGGGPNRDANNESGSSENVEATGNDAGTPASGNSENSSSNRGGFGGPPGDMPDMGNFDPSNMPEDFDPSNLPEGFDSENMPDMGNFDPGNMPNRSDAQGSNDSSEQKATDSGGQKPSFNGGPPSFPGGSNGMPTQPGGIGSLKTLAGYGICLLVMIAALILAKFYKRRR